MAKFNDRYVKTKNVKTETTISTPTSSNTEIKTDTIKNLDKRKIFLDSTVFLIVLIIIMATISVIIPTKINNYDIAFKNSIREEFITNQYDRNVYKNGSGTFYGIDYNIESNGVITLNGTRTRSTSNSLQFTTNVLEQNSTYNLHYTYLAGDISTGRTSYSDSFIYGTYNAIKYDKGVYFSFSNHWFFGSSIYYKDNAISPNWFNSPSIGYLYLTPAYYDFVYNNFSFKVELLPAVVENIGENFVSFENSVLNINQDFSTLQDFALTEKFTFYKTEDYSFDISFLDGYFDGFVYFVFKDENGVEYFSNSINNEDYYNTVKIENLPDDLKNLKLYVSSSGLEADNLYIVVNVTRVSLNEELKIGNVVFSNYTNIISKAVNFANGLPTLFEIIRVNVVDFFVNMWNGFVSFWNFHWLPWN